MTDTVNRASRDLLLHVTTTLSRTWGSASQMFGRAKSVLSYDRWMHATFGWALTPMQRLLPSAAWPMVHAYPGMWGVPTRGPGTLSPGGDMPAVGFTWWRNMVNPHLWQGAPRWQPAPPPALAPHSGPNAQNNWTFAVTPLFAFALGLGPAMGVGLLF